MKEKNNEKRIQTSVNNTGNDLRHEIKFENCEKNKNNFFIEKNIFFLEQKYIFSSSWKSSFYNS